MPPVYRNRHPRACAAFFAQASVWLALGIVPAVVAAAAGAGAAASIGPVFADLADVNAVARSGYDVPTGLPPSPLFGVRAFTQRMVLFEELALRPIPATDACPSCQPLPTPMDCRSSPDASTLDGFLAQPLHPLPTEYTDEARRNPWQNQISACIGRVLTRSVNEGRPPGVWFAHQRWEELRPSRYVQSVTAGARVNTGLRDAEQMHRYQTGEFGPGGLYHNTVGATGFEGTTRGIEVRLHPGLPAQQPNTVWTFDGTLPPKVLMARYGEPVVFRQHNALPIDDGANNGFGLHTLTTHHHNGHNPGRATASPAPSSFRGSTSTIAGP